MLFIIMTVGDIMTDREKQMYDFIGRLSKTKSPLVFKGGLITKLILDEGNYNSIQRNTVDIDANWIDTPPTMKELTEIISNALGELNDTFTVVPFREYNEKKSAGISFIDKRTNQKSFSIDIEMSPVNDTRTYYYGNMCISGIVPQEVITDKICAISTDKVYKHRFKDFIDTFALSHCVEIGTEEFLYRMEQRNKLLGNFDGLLNHKSDMIHAYDKMKRLNVRPDFDMMYNDVCDFIRPFMDIHMMNARWNCQSREWENVDKELDLIKQINKGL